MSKKIRNEIIDAWAKIQTAGKKVDHMTKVVEGFNLLVENKAVVISDSTVYLYRELWGSDPKTPPAWMANAYIYLRMKHDLQEGKTVYFRDIETDRLIGRYEGGKGIVVE